MNAAVLSLHDEVDPSVMHETFVARAKTLAPLLAERSTQINRDRMVSRDVIQMFRDAGFLKLLRPKRFGGYEGNFGTFIEVLDELAQGCGSSAWVCSVLGEHAWFMSCFSEQAQLEVWGANPDACASASFAPRPVRPEVGGYRASGQWSFASGCDHAQWLLLGAIGERPMMMLVPASDVTIIDDWNVLGLRGTGSKSIKLENVFVPSHRTLPYADLMGGTSPGSRVHPDYYLCRTPQQLLAPYSLPSVMLGQAQRALDLFGASLRDRQLPNGQLVAEQQMLQIGAAEAAVEIDMIRALMRGQVRRGVADMRAGKKPTLDGSLDGRRDFAYIAHRLVAVVLKLCALNGSRWVYDGDPLQTILRDVITASAHRGAAWDGLIGSGRAHLGLPPLPVF